MGLLKVGKPYSWDDAREHRQYVRHHGVVQFLNTYNRVKDMINDELLWGDEVEYGIFKVDSEAKTVKLSLRGAEILRELDEKEKASLHRLEGCTWHPEYGAWMVEATPRSPFAGYAADLVRVERNMRLRRKRILSVLRPGEVAPTMTCFPLMGVGDFVAPPVKAGPSSAEEPLSNRHGCSSSSNLHVRGPIANSAYVPDEIINPHPRFGALTKNIRGYFIIRMQSVWVKPTHGESHAAGLTPLRALPNLARRGQNVDIRIPLFKDKYTPEFKGEEAVLPPPPGVARVHGGVLPGRLETLDEKKAVDGFPTEKTGVSDERVHGEEEVAPPPVHMDAMAFGMGCCCLQVTFQARDIDESRFMYDQLAVLSPVMLALTAATPVLKGRLVDTDARWNTIALSVDDRTLAERGLLDHDPVTKEASKDPSMVSDGIGCLRKSRYDSISTYLHYCKRRAENPMHVLETYNDIPCEVDTSVERFLVDNGVDPALAYHVAHLFARDPLVIFEGAVEEVDDVTATEHFENIQSTNWQTVRWKPPPPRVHEDSPRIGWRTEFRSMEMQATDAENAAFVVFVVLVTRVILAFDLNLYIPLSKVDQNMRRAHVRDAVREKKFWWRMHMAPPDKSDASRGANERGEGNDQDHENGPHPCELSDGMMPAYVDQDHKACDEHTQGHEEMTIEEIMLGKGVYYPGLVPLVYAYLGHIGCDADTMDTIDQYMILICKRASGELQTTATWIREFVQSHPAYRHDSVVSDAIAYDLVMELRAIGEGDKHAKSLLGNLHISPVRPKQAYDVPLSSTKVSSKCLDFLVKKYAMRDRWTERDRQLAATNNSNKTSSAPAAASTHDIPKGNVWSQAHPDPPPLMPLQSVTSVQPGEPSSCSHVSGEAPGSGGLKQTDYHGNGQGGILTGDDFGRSSRDSSISYI